MVKGFALNPSPSILVETKADPQFPCALGGCDRPIVYVVTGRGFGPGGQMPDSPFAERCPGFGKFGRNS